MVKLNIRDMESFLAAVNCCTGKVFLLCPDGKKVNISGDSAAQGHLWSRYRQNGNYLPLALNIPEPRDYMRIVMDYVMGY